MNDTERERIVREVWHSWFREKYPDVTEQTGPPPNAYEIIYQALNLALPPGTVPVKVGGLRELEWTPGYQHCQACGSYKCEGHAPGCWLAKALKEGEQ